MKTNTSTTLQDLIIASKCRKGKAEAITAKGAYWLAIPAITIHTSGGDGIGQSSAACRNSLQLRHYRDGTVETVVKFYSRHQNYGHSKSFLTVPLLKCKTTEEIIVILKALKASVKGLDECYNDHLVEAYEDYYQDELEAALVSLGLPEYEIPSPDDDPAAAI